MNQVFVCGTYFTIYVSILLTINRKNKNSKSLLILNDHTPEIEKIIPALKGNGFFDYYLPVPFRKIEEQLKKEKGIAGKILNRNKLITDYVENNSEIGQFDAFFQNSEFNLTYLWGFPSAYFIIKYPNNLARIIEDGTRNYILKTSSFKFFKRKYILKTFIGDGFDESVKEVMVQYPEKLDARLRYKGVKLELKTMQENLSADDHARILKVFLKDQVINLVDRKKLLLITQPFSEDGFMTEESKLKLYEGILDEYAEDFEVYLKAHPRETTNYKEKLNRNFIEIPRSFPLELLDIMNAITFDSGVTLFSSSMKNLACIKNKITLGKEYVKNPLKKMYV